MEKRLEMSDPKSCLNKAKDDELLFVLLARDPASVVAVRAWIAARILLGKNDPGDAQLREAREWADKVERWLGADVASMTRAASSLMPAPGFFRVWT